MEECAAVVESKSFTNLQNLINDLEIKTRVFEADRKIENLNEMLDAGHAAMGEFKRVTVTSHPEDREELFKIFTRLNTALNCVELLGFSYFKTNDVSTLM